MLNFFFLFHFCRFRNIFQFKTFFNIYTYIERERERGVTKAKLEIEACG